VVSPFEVNCSLSLFDLTDSTGIDRWIQPVWQAPRLPVRGFVKSDRQRKNIGVQCSVFGVRVLSFIKIKINKVVIFFDASRVYVTGPLV
jgi:hypothetical protein